MIDLVLLFHSTLQLKLAPSREYSDHPNIGANDQNKPINIDMIVAIKASRLQFFLIFNGSLIALSLEINYL